MKTEREFKLVVPKFDNDGHRISTEKLKEIALEMSKHFGGVSVFPKVLGCWEGKEGLECEENALLVSARDSSDEKQFKDDMEFMKNLAKKVGNELGQEAVMLSEDIIKDVSFIAGLRKKEVPEAIREKDFFKKLMD